MHIMSFQTPLKMYGAHALVYISAKYKTAWIAQALSGCRQ